MIWIKICATTNLDDALASLDAGANALGFILTPSPRQITPEAAATIIAALPPSTEKIGVVVNETPQRLAELAHQTGLTGLQLHGDEPADQLPEYRRALGLRKIIKTLQARELLAVAPARSTTTCATPNLSTASSSTPAPPPPAEGPAFRLTGPPLSPLSNASSNTCPSSSPVDLPPPTSPPPSSSSIPAASTSSPASNSPRARKTPPNSARLSPPLASATQHP